MGYSLASRHGRLRRQKRRAKGLSDRGNLADGINTLAGAWPGAPCVGTGEKAADAKSGKPHDDGWVSNEWTGASSKRMTMINDEKQVENQRESGHRGHGELE